jgi:hypothetical protein
MYAFLTAGLLCLFLARGAYRRSANLSGESLKTAAALTQILKTPSVQIQTFVSSDRRGPLYAAQGAYLDLNFRRSRAEISNSSLLTLAACMRAADTGLNMECKSFAKVLLSDWVFNRPESSWHSHAEVDAFFRVLKESRYHSLENFLKNRPVDFESKYLSQI